MNVSQTVRSRMPPLRYSQAGIVKRAYSAAATAPAVRSASVRASAQITDVMTAAASTSSHTTTLDVHPNIEKAPR